ncbi:MAG: hypothetical protein NUV76_12370 [Candidatus Kuenenia sp.]|nr:hypothetical protein [Candidatus Kuenenia sp.]
MTQKVKCKECSWHGIESEILIAENPFKSSVDILGCPTCKGVNTIICVCDEPECWLEVSCGTPTLDGYRNTCSKHMPKAEGMGTPPCLKQIKIAAPLW